MARASWYRFDMARSSSCQYAKLPAASSAFALTRDRGAAEERARACWVHRRPEARSPCRCQKRQRADTNRSATSPCVLVQRPHQGGPKVVVLNMKQAHKTLEVGSAESRLGGLGQFQKEVGMPALNLPGLRPMLELFEAVLPDGLEGNRR